MLEGDILYKSIRNLPIYECPEFVEWMKEKQPNFQFHHGIGSQTGIKLNDLLGIMLTYEQHQYAEANKKEFFIDNLPEFIKNLCDFVMYQRSLLKQRGNKVSTQKENATVKA